MEQKSDSTRPAPGKRAFTAPTLRVYGTIAEITGTTNQSGMPDRTGVTKDNMTRP
jgi:hypothetical protein